MKKTLSIICIIAIVFCFAFTLSACDNDSDEIGIDRFEIEDLELTEGDKFNRENVIIIAHKTDGATANVQNNLEYDLSAMEDVLDDEETLSDQSAGEYIVPVYHLQMHIGDLKVIVSVKK